MHNKKFDLGWGIIRMTSEDRRENRYQRRKQKRIDKRKGFQGTYGSLKNLTDFDNLIHAFTMVKRGVSWKESIQRFDRNLFRNIEYIQDKLDMGESIIHDVHTFYTYERGKLREIRSLSIMERVIQRLICDECLSPIVSHYIIYDNSASIKNRGFDFSIKRICNHIRKFIRENGVGGYILLIDFTKYYDNILHQPLFEMIDKMYIDENLKKIMKAYIRRFEIDKEDGKSLGLGSQISQMLAVYYLNEIEHFIKDYCGYKYYGRYMDDSYFIVKTKEEAHEILNLIMPMYEKLGIQVNKKKTQIVKLTHPFVFLKARFHISETGKISLTIDHKSVVRMRRKLKKFKKFYDNNLMDLNMIEQSLQSWIAHAKRYKSHKTIQSMIALYNDLFINPFMGTINQQKCSDNKENS